MISHSTSWPLIFHWCNHFFPIPSQLFPICSSHLRWTEIPNMNTKRRNFALVLTPDNVLWAIGGTCEGRMSSSIEFLNIGTALNWKVFDHELLSPRNNHSAIHWKGAIFIVGGCNDKGNPIEYMETFKLSRPTSEYKNGRFTTYGYTHFERAQYILRGPSYSSLLCKLTSLVPYEGDLYTTGEFSKMISRSIKHQSNGYWRKLS